TQAGEEKDVTGTHTGQQMFTRLPGFNARLLLDSQLADQAFQTVQLRTLTDDCKPCLQVPLRKNREGAHGQVESLERNQTACGQYGKPLISRRLLWGGKFMPR